MFTDQIPKKIKVTEEVWEKIQSMCKKAQPLEWLGYLYGEPTTKLKNEYEVSEIWIPEQFCSPSTCESDDHDDNKKGSIMFSAKTEKALIGWVHSHVSMGAFLSGTDYTNIEDLMKPMRTGFCISIVATVNRSKYKGYVSVFPFKEGNPSKKPTFETPFTFETPIEVVNKIDDLDKSDKEKKKLKKTLLINVEKWVNTNDDKIRAYIPPKIKPMTPITDRRFGYNHRFGVGNNYYDNRNKGYYKPPSRKKKPKKQVLHNGHMHTLDEFNDMNYDKMLHIEEISEMLWKLPIERIVELKKSIDFFYGYELHNKPKEEKFLAREGFDVEEMEMEEQRKLLEEFGFTEEEIELELQHIKTEAKAIQQ